MMVQMVIPKNQIKMLSPVFLKYEKGAFIKIEIDYIPVIRRWFSMILLELEKNNLKVCLHCDGGVVYLARKVKNKIIKLFCPYGKSDCYCNSLCAQFHLSHNIINKKYCFINVCQGCTGKEYSFREEEIL